MKIRMNSAMKDALVQYGIAIPSGAKLEYANIFQEILSEGISSEKDCLLLKKNLSLCKGVTIKDFPDLTGYECYINKINVDDYLITSDPKELLECSLHLAKLLEGKLSVLHESVQIVIGFQVDDITTSFVRFHKVRSNESWLNDDLEKYGECMLTWAVN